MFCTKCGKQIEDTSVFCRYCGAKAIRPASLEAPTPIVKVTEAVGETGGTGPVEAAGVEPVVEEIVMVDTVEVEPVVVEPVETVNVEVEPVDVETVEAEVVEVESVDVDPVVAEPVETVNVEVEPVVAGTAESKPDVAEIVEVEVVEVESKVVEPVETVTAEVEPVVTGTVEVEAVETEPVVVESIETVKVEVEPIVAETVNPELVVAETVEAEPILEENVEVVKIETDKLVVETISKEEQAPVVELPEEKLSADQSTEEIKRTVEFISVQSVESMPVNPVVEVKAEQVNKTQINQTQINQEQINPTQKSVSEVAPKKKGKKGIVLAAILCVLLIGGGVFGYFTYQNYLTGQAEKVIALFDDEQYEESLEIYEKYCEKKDALKDSIKEELSTRAEQIKDDFLAEKIEYSVVLEKLDAITDYGNRNLKNEVEEIEDLVELIYDSRENYKLGKLRFDSGDYRGAIEAYELVNIEDIGYYSMATAGIIEAQRLIDEEEQRIQEANRIKAAREEALASSLAFYSQGDYASAIASIEEGLLSIPGDITLTEKLSYYENLYKMTTKVDIIKSSDYVTTYVDDDIDLVRVNLAVPVLSGDLASYQYINEIFETIKTSYIETSEELANEIRTQVEEEYFVANAVNMTYEISYNNNGILCVILNVDEYFGGAHGNPYRLVYAFDLATGEEKNLEDLISISESDFKTVAVTKFEELISVDPTAYWEEALESINNKSGFDFDYYIKEDGIHLFTHPYELGSFAMGFVEVLIPFTGNEEMFTILK